MARSTVHYADSKTDNSAEKVETQSIKLVKKSLRYGLR